MKFALVAMNVRFLYIICNFEIFSTVNSSMASKMAAKLKKIYLLVTFAVLSNKIYTFLLLGVFDITS